MNTLFPTMITTVTLLSASAGAQHFAWNTVAIIGEHVPGMPDDVVYSNIGGFALNANGEVALVAEMSGDSINPMYKNALMRGTTDLGLTPFLREGEQAQGYPDGVVYEYLGSAISAGYQQTPVLNNAGNLVMKAATTLVPENYFIATRSGDVSLVASSGSQAADLPTGVNYRSFDMSGEKPSPYIAENSSIVFHTTLSGTGVNSNNNFGIFRRTLDGNAQTIIRTGSPSIGTLHDTHTIFGVEEYDMATDGRTSMMVANRNPTLDLFRSIVIEDMENNLIEVALQGAQVSNMAPGTKFAIGTKFFGLKMLNETRTSFGSLINGPGIDATNNQVLFEYDLNTGLSITARKGDTIPGLAGDYRYNAIFADVPFHSTAGHTVFQASISGAGVNIMNDRVLISNFTKDGHKVVARTGDQVPGLAGGITFRTFGDAFVNSNQSMVFYAHVLDGGEIFPAIFYTGANSELQLIAMVGDEIDVDSDPFRNDYRTIENIQPRKLTDTNLLGFRADFTDGTRGYFTIAVPAPNTLLALLTLPLIASRRRPAH